MTDAEMVPYAPDMTPATLAGDSLAQDQVLPWLLALVRDLPTKSDLSQAIQDGGLSHIAGAKDRRDMASHVVQGLRNYGLMDESDDGSIELSEIGQTILEAPVDTRDAVFARHILANCNGLRLIEAIQRRQLRGQPALLEELATELDRDPTAKSISTMKAWLARAGIFKGRAYKVDARALERTLGSDVPPLIGLNEAEVEFVLAARLREAQTDRAEVRASAVKRLAISRRPGLKIPHKGLGKFVRSLAARGVLEVGTSRGRGGSASTVKLVAAGRQFAEDHLRALLSQAESGLPLADLPSLEQLLGKLDEGHSHARGHAGELLAVHLCLALGLRIEEWRSRAPEAEIDLVAERTAAHSYQRWAVQVKNTGTNVSSDRIDREVGAAAGAGITHILFVAPRASLTGAAEREAIVRSRLADIHVYWLDQSSFVTERPLHRILDALDTQAHELALAKRLEARRRSE